MQYEVQYEIQGESTLALVQMACLRQCALADADAGEMEDVLGAARLLEAGHYNRGRLDY